MPKKIDKAGLVGVLLEQQEPQRWYCSYVKVRINDDSQSIGWTHHAWHDDMEHVISAWKPKLQHPAFWGGIIAIVVFALYLPALALYLRGDDFPWLDLAYPLRHSLRGLVEKDFVFFRPTVRLSYFLNYALFRQNVVAYNLINVSFHVLNVVLLYIHMLRLSKRTMLAAVTALLFGTSSFYSEVPTWAAARPDLHVTACILGTLVVFSREKVFGGIKAWGVYLLLLAGAFGSKENWMILPVLLLGLLLFCQRYAVKRALLVTLPAFMLLGVYITIFFIVPAVRQSTSPLAYDRPLQTDTIRNAIVKGGFLIYKYLGFGDYFYGHAWQIALLGIIGVIGVWGALRLKSRITFWGLFWMVLAMAPTMHIYYAPSRFNYLPLMGFWIMSVAFIDTVVRAIRRKWPISQRALSLCVAVCIGYLVVYHGIMVQWEIHDYRILGDFHKAIVEKYREIADRVPINQTILLIDAGARDVVVEFDRAMRGHLKMQYSKPGGLWNIIYFDHLANYAGHPFEQMMQFVEEAELATLIEQPYAVLTFTDEGFRLDLQPDDTLRKTYAATKRLPGKIQPYVLRPLRGNMSEE